MSLLEQIANVIHNHELRGIQEGYVSGLDTAETILSLVRSSFNKEEKAGVIACKECDVCKGTGLYCSLCRQSERHQQCVKEECIHCKAGRIERELSISEAMAIFYDLINKDVWRKSMQSGLININSGERLELKK